MARVLVVRNDKVGDFMLAWPALALLKRAGCHVGVLVPPYTADLALACPYVNEIVIDPGKDAPFEQQKSLLQEIVENSYDASLTLFSTWRIGVLLRQAAIPYRLAPATKFAQILYTRRVTQRRSRSIKPEWEYNLDLAAVLLSDLSLTAGSVSAPYWQFDHQKISQQRQAMAASLALSEQANWLMVHVGSGGSANNLSLAQYGSLISLLSVRLPSWMFVLTAGPGEQSAVGGLLTQLINQRVPVACLSGLSLPELGLAMACVQAFMAGSTGPLHMAGALDVPTIGFYTNRQSATALRWQTLNAPKHRKAITPTPQMACQESFEGLNLQAVADDIAQWLMTPAIQRSSLSG